MVKALKTFTLGLFGGIKNLISIYLHTQTHTHIRVCVSVCAYARDATGMLTLVQTLFVVGVVGDQFAGAVGGDLHEAPLGAVVSHRVVRTFPVIHLYVTVAHLAHGLPHHTCGGSGDSVSML